MVSLQATRKAFFIGKWHEDTFSEEILKNIAAHAKAEKGKRIKIILNKDGLRIVRQKLLKDDEVEFYPLKNIKTVTKNTRSDSCVMFIMSDEVKKYQIIALRCECDADVVYILNFFGQVRKSNSFKDVELRKRTDTGNWTLRERSAHNASLHLKEVFKEQQRQNSTEEQKTVVIANGVHSGNTTVVTKAPNGILKQSSKEDNNNNSYPYASHTADISEQTTTSWKAGTISAYSTGGLDTNQDDTAKALEEHVRIAQRMESVGSESRRGSAAVVQVPSSIQTQHQQANGRIYATAGTRRVSGDQALYRQYRPHRAASGRSSMVAYGNTQNMIVGSLRSKPRAQSMRGNFTVQRSIEDTYATKPVIIHQAPHPQSVARAQPVLVQGRVRRGSGNSIILRKNQRLSSIHVMGGNQLLVHQNMADMKL